MEKYIIDERTGWKYELVGDYYLPVGTRFDAANQDVPEVSQDTENPTSESKAAVQTAPTIPTANSGNQTLNRPAIGRFGRAHAAYLKSTKHHVYSQLTVEGKLSTYLAQIDKQANAMLELLIRQMADREGVNEELKATDQMKWVRRMNSIRNQAEEIVCNDLIFT